MSKPIAKLTVKAIVAMSEDRVIGINNQLPWHLPEDMKHFAELTTGHSILMGRKTYESLPEKYRPLPKRQNIVVSRNTELELPENVMLISNPREFIQQFKAGEVNLQSNQLWIIGGAKIYEETMSLCDGIELTVVKGEYEGDAYLPEFESGFQLSKSTETGKLSFLTYESL